MKKIRHRDLPLGTLIYHTASKNSNWASEFAMVIDSNDELVTYRMFNRGNQHNEYMTGANGFVAGWEIAGNKKRRNT